MKKQLKLWVFLILVVLVTPAVSSCATSQIKTYTFKHYGVSFSFEYPSSYKRISSYIQDNPGAPIGVRFARARGFFGLLSTDPVFVVNIDSPLSVKEPDPKSTANIAGSHSADQELEGASILIAGTVGELVAYSSSDFQNTPSVTREVFFSVNGILWSISIYSGIAKADEAKLDFEHIVTSFKIMP